MRAVPKQTKIVPKRTKVAKKTYIVIPILRTISGGGVEKDNAVPKRKKLVPKTPKLKVPEKSAETGGNQVFSLKKRGPADGLTLWR